MLRIAILTRPDNASPKVLANSLHDFLEQTASRSKVFFGLRALKRLSPHAEVKVSHGRLGWTLYKALHFIGDWLLFSRLKRFDAIVICECCPYAFLQRSLNIERLRARVGKKPILYYEVYFLENAPTVVERLRNGHHHLTDYFDWHLAVSDVTEIRRRPQAPWSRIGLFLKTSGLQPRPKKKLLAVVDFEREGHEHFRRDQIRVLKELGIPYVSLDQRYSIQEIRDIYQEATFYFVQFREAFGLPIAECLCAGSYILMPDASWAMSWRLDERPQVHGPGVMAECFVVYDSADDLKRKLIALREWYHLTDTPREIFDCFRTHYPWFYEGDIEALKAVLSRLQNREI